MAERKRVMKSTVQGAIENYKSATQKLKPKMDLSERELELFDHIVTSAETSVWNSNRLFIASNLAVMYRRLEEISEQLDEEGVVLRNERGTQITNPLFSALTQLTTASMQMNRSLGLSAPQQGASGMAQEKRNIADNSAREAIKKAKHEEDDLLA
jgi:hypothetical protein